DPAGAREQAERRRGDRRCPHGQASVREQRRTEARRRGLRPPIPNRQLPNFQGTHAWALGVGFWLFFSPVRKLLLQLDTSQHASAFDRIVALDAGADEVMSYGGVTPDAVR